MRPEEPYNPLDKRNLGFSVAEAMLERQVVKLPPPEAFDGAGVYAIYYVGKFPAYKRIAEKNKDDKFGQPIYVGKAVPKGARKGAGLGLPPGRVLFSRLKEHAESITEVRNLDLKDFRCRYLVVDDIWIPLGESLLVEMFKPIWNKVIEGFGIHDPGGGRSKQKRSPWDVLHPGRSFADKLAPGKYTDKQILENVEKWFVGQLPASEIVSDLDAVLADDDE